MKVFLSQPMAGKTLEQIERERAAVRLPKGAVILPSVLKCQENTKHRSVWYLAKSLEVMAAADVVFFMSGWEKARGCRIEHEVARNYEIPMMYEVGVKWEIILKKLSVCQPA